MSEESSVLFTDLGLDQSILKAVADQGYESPTEIQASSIPSLLDGRDILGQAQTGTGKTASFALPVLHNLDQNLVEPQVLVLAPTRELALQVSDAFATYSKYMDRVRILSVYGGQGYREQLSALSRGVQIIVGTPGRVMDHIKRGTLVLNRLKTIVLDEADEMLRMGFIDDVEWIMEQTPADKQVALFSATMPRQIQKIAETYLVNPEMISIKKKTATAANINQRYWLVKRLNRLDALTRILEVEKTDAAIVFVKTKAKTLELAEAIRQRGFKAEALNGDIAQPQRERIVDRLRKGYIDILVATDVVARGLDVKRVSHVINYELPGDNESYIHRIGRTGRAGNSGEAILFVSNKERRVLKSIERTIRQPIAAMKIPSADEVNKIREERFKLKIYDAMNLDSAEEEAQPFRKIISELQEENELDPLAIAVALAKMAQGDEPLYLKEKPVENNEYNAFEDLGERRGNKSQRSSGVKMERYRMDVGYDHGVKPGNIVGALANEGGIGSQFIGQIEIKKDHSFVDLPEGMPSDVSETLKNAWVCQQQLNLKKVGGSGKPSGSRRPFKGKRRDFGSKPPKRTRRPKPAGSQKRKRA